MEEDEILAHIVPSPFCSYCVAIESFSNSQEVGIASKSGAICNVMTSLSLRASMGNKAYQYIKPRGIVVFILHVDFHSASRFSFQDLHGGIRNAEK